MAEQIAKLEIPKDMHVEALVVADNDDITEHMVFEAFKKAKFKKFVAFQSMNRPGGQEFNSFERRNRICEVMERAKQHIPEGTDFVFIVEDDSEVPENALTLLYETYCNIDEVIPGKIGLVSGLQAGRWGIKMIGAWRVDNVKDPNVIKTIPFDKRVMIDKVDGTGFYCMLTPAKLFKEHEFTWHDECFGPDVMYGLTLKQKGYKNFVDWDVLIGHATADRVIQVDDECVVLTYTKKNDIWKLESAKKKV